MFGNIAPLPALPEAMMQPDQDPAPETPVSERQQRAAAWFAALRERICAAFEAVEDAYSGADASAMPAGRFVRRSWARPGGGGGTMAMMHGRVFEKVGVNLSTVFGEFAPEFRNEIPGAGEDPRFWASGISLVAHMRSPLVPAVHMNTRHIVTSKAWFGGGADLTPIYPDAAAAAQFHAALEAGCAAYDPLCYARFKAECDKYFYLPHRSEARGAGGIFFDYLDSGDWERDFALVRAVGEAFLAVYPAIVKPRMDLPWSAEQRRHQLVRRGRYVEFNLLYDRGTRFGLRTGGNVEAILMSLPPEAAWP
jgi:coproporphyrinogen III oxidase